MNDLIVLVIILGLLSWAIYIIYRNKKNNVKCSSCAYQSTCPMNIEPKIKLQSKPQNIPILNKTHRN
ncbi:MAG: FeoB-associated Cys-rich membrane protein [Clostridium sp.]|nr:FeoB-associated Cys-rich membrane protein [Clostridium sp.]